MKKTTSFARHAALLALVVGTLVGATGCGVSSTPNWMEARTPGAPRAETAGRRETVLASERAMSSRSGSAATDRHVVRAASR